MGDAGGVAETVRACFDSEQPMAVVSAYLFGSHARGAAHRESDVDVAVLFNHAAVPDCRERGRRAVRLSTHLVAQTHCNAVDVVVLNDAPPELAVAAASGLRLHCADPERDHAFRRTVMSRLADLRPFFDQTRRLKVEALAR